jgi:hypothetical protein
MSIESRMLRATGQNSAWRARTRSIFSWSSSLAPRSS